MGAAVRRPFVLLLNTARGNLPAMDKTNSHKAAVFLFCLLFSLLSGFSASALERVSGDQLMLAAEPIFVGKEAFIDRIALRTGAERDSVGLVLSGGSARAFAHIGVLKRLEEAGVVPDFIVANSMGSIIGLLYAAGLSPDQIFSIVTSTDLAALFEPTLPLAGGVLDPSRFSDLVHLYVGDKRLEELPIPIMISCEDLRSKREIRIASGDFITVLLAAFALPAIFPPVEFDGFLLIDGGVTKLVPLSAAMEFSDKVIVSSTFYDNKSLNLRNPIVVLNSAIDIGKRRAGVSDLLAYPEALWIRCAVESYSFMAFDKSSELAEIGYRSADAHAEALTAFAFGGVDSALTRIRGKLDTRIDSGRQIWAPFNRAPADKAVFAIAPFISSLSYPLDGYRLNDSVFAGVSAAFRWSGFSFSLRGGSDWRPYDKSDFLPSAAVSFLGDLLPFLSLEGLAVASWDKPSLEPYPSWYWRGAVRAVSPASFGRLEAFSIFEGVAGRDLAKRLLTSGAAYKWVSDQNSSSDAGAVLGEAALEAGHELSGAWDTHALWAYMSLGLSPFPLSAAPLTIRGRGLARIALGGKAAAYYLSDPVSASDSSFVDDIGAALYGAGLSLGWEPGTASLSLAELLILRRPAFSAFSDVLWAGNGFSVPKTASLGFRVSTELSLLGLQSSLLTLETGYDLINAVPYARVFMAP